MIETATLETDEGTITLRLVGYMGAESLRHTEETGDWTFTASISDDALAELDRALQSWRDHIAEGESIRRERLAAGDPADGYPPDDPKHPGYRDRMIERAERMGDHA